MPDARQTLDALYLEMRWRIVSLAADFDRIERAPGGKPVAADDPRLLELSEAIRIVLGDSPERARRVQELLSDKSSAPLR